MGARLFVVVWLVTALLLFYWVILSHNANGVLL